MNENAKRKQLNRRIHTNPYSTLTSGNIKFGYFEYSVVPSSNEPKENIVGGSQPGSLA